ncbi:MAG: TolC family protein [Pseudomonadota bacterium]
MSYQKPLAAILLAALMAANPAAAQEGVPPPGATVQELLDLAKRQNAELAAMQQEAEAAEARVQPAGALPDPALRVELQDISRTNPNLLPGRVGATKYTLLQSLPLWGKRDLRREIAEADASQAGGRRQIVEAELGARIKTAFAQYYQAVRTTALTGEILQLMRDLERVAQTRYATGLAPQQDAIKAQTEQTALRSELIALQTEQHHARTRLNALLNRPPHAPLADPRELRPLPAAGLDAAKLEARLRQSSPALAAQQARIAAAETGQRLVEKNRYPDLTVGISPIQRGSGWDTWEAMFEINIPLQRETRRSQEREAAAMAAAARLRHDALSSQLNGEFQESVSAYETAREQERLFENSLLPQAELTFQSALAGYRTGKVDFATLLDAQRQIKKARLDQLKARVEQEIRRAEIERLLGEEL